MPTPARKETRRPPQACVASRNPSLLGLHGARPRQPLEKDPEEEAGEAEQEPQSVEPAGADDEINDRHQPEELEDVLEEEPLTDRSSACERLLQNLPDQEEVPPGDGGADRDAGEHPEPAGDCDSGQDKRRGKEELPFRGPKRRGVLLLPGPVTRHRVSSSPLRYSQGSFPTGRRTDTGSARRPRTPARSRRSSATDWSRATCPGSTRSPARRRPRWPFPGPGRCICPVPGRAPFGPAYRSWRRKPMFPIIDANSPSTGKPNRETLASPVGFHFPGGPPRSAARAAAIVRSRSPRLCASERKPASNCDGAM